MSRSYNKGEWSEFYVFLKILNDRKIYAANDKLEKIKDLFYPIRKVLRKDKEIYKTYDLLEDNIVNIYETTNQNNIATLNTDIIKSSIIDIFETIKNTKGRSFEIPGIDEILQQLRCETIKADHNNKDDIRLIIHDNITLHDTEVGFSIKSNVGSSPTLLNASKATNFSFIAVNYKKDINDINNISGSSKIRDRIQALYADRIELEFCNVGNEIFYKNLKKIDSLMPEILSQFLLAFFTGQGRTIAELTNAISKNQKIQSLGFDFEDLKFKVKHLLLNIALGMVPTTLWDGFLKADGGYIVVKEDGDIVCYHIYNVSQFSEYLFNNTRLETPSTSRHSFGNLYLNDNLVYINLNLQIRFI